MAIFGRPNLLGLQIINSLSYKTEIDIIWNVTYQSSLIEAVWKDAINGGGAFNAKQKKCETILRL